MPKITKLRLHLLILFRENYWLLFSGHGVSSYWLSNDTETDDLERRMWGV